MIFVTVGAQMPFDRLIRAVDTWAGAHPQHEVRAQIGPTELRPEHLRSEGFLPPERFRALMEEASAVVAHAGMGTILTALELGKPTLVFPRRERFAETRSDHQVATARHFAEQGRLRAVYEPEALAPALDALLSAPPPETISAEASGELLARIRAFAIEAEA